MGLFINNRSHPDVFKSQDEIKEPNQVYMRRDFMTELIKEQQEANAVLKRAVEELKSQSKKQDSQLSQLKDSHHHQEELDHQLLNSVKMLEEKIDMEIEHRSLMTSRLEQQESSFEKLSAQMEEQLELQKDAVEFQNNVLTRLDSQEALTEKLLRQLNHIRSILFERTNYIATKIEDGYKITSSYVYKMMTGSEKPLTFFRLNENKEENQHID